MAARSRIAGIDWVAGGDDLVLPFHTVGTRAFGRIVRLGYAVDAILSRHDYPALVARVLGETLALTALLGAGLKIDGRLIVQTKTDGPIGLIVADWQTPGHIRGYASFDADRLEAAERSGQIDPAALLGQGHMALTIDAEGQAQRYQGIVTIDGDSITDAATAYFRQSEQLPTLVRLAVARHFTAGADGAAGAWRWRAGGLVVQNLALAGEEHRKEQVRDDGLVGDDDEDWERVRLLASTVEDHELVDPQLAAEDLAYRLFHEDGVRATTPVAVLDQCRCSRERVVSMLQSFGADAMADMTTEDGSVAVTCEFCSTNYVVDPSEIVPDATDPTA